MVYRRIVLKEESTGALIKRLREQRGLSQRKLASLSGIDRGYINQLEAGRGGSISLRLARALAGALAVRPEIFLNSENIEYPAHRPLEAILAEAQQRYELLEIVELPIRGTIPAGYPSSEEENIDGYVSIPKEELGAVKKGIYALKVNGDSLQGDGIYSGDLVIVEPNPEISDGKIYAIRLENEVVARHLYQEDNKVKLASSNGSYQVMEVNQVEILGRIILSGRWKKH